MNAPDYIKALLKPTTSNPKGRKVWSIDLETVWLPFLTATNLMGDTAIPHEAMGAPLRLGYDADGSVKFGKSGRPVVKVVKEIADSVKLVRENMIAGLMAFTHEVVEFDPEGYQGQIIASIEAGKPIIEKDNRALTEAYAAIAEAERIAAQTAAEKVAAEKAEKVAAEKAQKAEKVAVTA